MSKSKEQRKKDKAMAAEAKQKAKDDKALARTKKAGVKAGKRAYEYMVVGGLALFFQGVILCSTGYFWSGGFLFPLAFLCWIKAMSRAFTTCLAVVGFAICVFELCDCVYSLTDLYFKRDQTNYHTPQWITTIALNIVGAVLAALGFITFPMAVIRYSQAASLTRNADESVDAAATTPRDIGEAPVEQPPNTPPNSNRAAGYPRPTSPANAAQELHPAQLITGPYAQPQPILVAGPLPPLGQAGLLQPAGYAYVAYPPNAPRTTIPTQPLTGQPILAGQPIMFPQYVQTAASPQQQQSLYGAASMSPPLQPHHPFPPPATNEYRPQ